MENWVLLGASRGLGKAFLEKALLETAQNPREPKKLFVLSRKPPEVAGEFDFHSADFSKRERWESIRDLIRSFEPHRLFYFAGGGPFGRTQDKNWNAHEWAWKVSFEFPAFLLHQTLKEPGQTKQMIFIGSAIAEAAADPRASSYCAAKHALKGFITSIQLEQTPVFDLRLFSPGYIDTDLLPPHAWPRQHEGMVTSAPEIAEKLWAFAHNRDDVNKHFVLKSFP